MFNNAGDLDCRVIVQEPVETTGADGSVVIAWQAYVSRWASIRQQGHSESLVASQIAPTSTHTITMHKTDGITSKMRVTYGARTFYIEGVQDTNERHSQTVLFVKEDV